MENSDCFANHDILSKFRVRVDYVVSNRLVWVKTALISG
jgi:hypothetical protein